MPLIVDCSYNLFELIEMEIKIENILSEKNKPHLLVNGYKFYCHHVNKNLWEMWRCTHKKCKCKLKRFNGDNVAINYEQSILNAHKHPKDKNLNRHIVLNNIKRKMLCNDELMCKKPLKIIRKELADDETYEDSPDLNLNDISCIRKGIYLCKRSTMPPLPKILRKFIHH